LLLNPGVGHNSNSLMTWSMFSRESWKTSAGLSVGEKLRGKIVISSTEKATAPQTGT
jgi:hypothetical protein